MSNLLIILLLLLLTIILALLVILVHFLTVSLSSLIFSIILYLIFRKLVSLSIYPGSSRFVRKSLESTYRKELSQQIHEKIIHLRDYLELLILRSTRIKDYKIENIKIFISSLITVYSQMAKLSSHQKEMLNYIKVLKDHLSETKITINDSEDFSLFDFLEIRKDCSNIFKISLKDFAQTSSAGKSLEICNNFKTFLENSFESSSWLRSAYHYLFDDSIGSIDYMRADLLNRFKCTEFQLSRDNDKYKVDCLHLRSEDESSTVFVLCNANAGYFEYLYFQSNWIEFYLSHGVHLVLWNYRGYGRSSGHPYFPDLVSDGVELVSYIRKTFNYQKIGIHGESLGGSVAACIADQVAPDFLLCDRTYSSLGNAVTLKYGKAAYYLFKLSCHADIDTVQAYLAVDAAKLIVNDPHDKMVTNLASLKTGVAIHICCPKYQPIRRLILNNSIQDFQCFLSQEQGKVLCKALKRIGKTWQSMRDASTKEEIKNLKTEQGDQELDYKNNVNKVVYVLNEIQTAGLRLIEVAKFKIPLAEIQVWFMVFEIWGGNYGENSSFLISRIAELRILASLIKEADPVDLWKDVETVARTLEMVYDGLIERSGRRSAGPDEILIGEDFKKAGSLLGVDCGHNGDFSISDRERYRRKLVEAQIIEI